MYLATNWQKTDAGNFVYGEVTYVVNPIYADKFFIAPWDTGRYVGNPSHTGQHVGNPSHTGQHVGNPSHTRQHVGNPSHTGRYAGNPSHREDLLEDTNGVR